MKVKSLLVSLFTCGLLLAGCNGGGETSTSSPTSSPTSQPTSAPTSSPTSAPTSAPTSEPTSAPTSAHSHVWGAPTYEWSKDYSKCTAKRVCTDNSEHVETETVDSVYEVTQKATCEVNGKATYTATFTNAAFEKQVHEVTLPATDHNFGEITYKWSDDHKTCTATKPCLNDETHNVVETVTAKKESASYASSETQTIVMKDVYTATFENEDFEKQTFESDPQPVDGFEKLSYELVYNQYYKVKAASAGVTGEIFVPDFYDNVPVAKIEEYAFAQCEGITNIIISNSITELGNSIFYPKYTEYPMNLKYIGSFEKWMQITDKYGLQDVEEVHLYFDNCEAEITELIVPPVRYDSLNYFEFYRCTGLKKVGFEEGITAISSYAFGYCKSLRDITFPSTIEYIGSYAFTRCTSLIIVEVPESIKRIESSAFNYCTALASIAIRNANVNMEDNVFNNCDCLKEIIYGKDPQKSFIDENGLVIYARDDGSVLTQYCGTNKDVVIPDHITSIENKAFADNSVIESVSIGAGVTYIHHEAFARCENLKTVEFKGSLLKTIDDSAFYSCKKLESINLPEGLEEIGMYAFNSCSSLEEIVVPDSIKTIEDCAFGSCVSLKTLVIGTGLETLGYDVLGGCDAIESITIPFLANTESKSQYLGYLIGNNHDYYNKDFPTSIKSVTLTREVEELSGGIFKDCSSLESITLPAGIKTIGSSAFSNCSSLTELNIPDTVTTVEIYAFSGCESLHYNNDGVAYYLGDETYSFTVLVKAMWEGMDTPTYEVKEHCHVICHEAFKNCSNLKRLIVHEDLTYIGLYAFQNTSNLVLEYHGTEQKWFDFPRKDFLYGCCSVELYLNGDEEETTTFHVPEGVETIEQYSLAMCRHLNTVYIPHSVTRIEDYALNDNIYDVYYDGTEEEWNNLDIAYYWGAPSSVTMHYAVA